MKALKFRARLSKVCKTRHKGKATMKTFKGLADKKGIKEYEGSTLKVYKVDLKNLP